MFPVNGALETTGCIIYCIVSIHQFCFIRCCCHCTGGGYAKLKERQGSKEFLDSGTASSSKMSPDGVDEGVMAECKGEQLQGRQSVGLLAGLMKRAVATADRYKQFIDADVDTEAAPITSSDCDADGHSDEYNDPHESKSSLPDFQYTRLDDPGHHSLKPLSSSVSTPVTAVTTTTSAHHQVVQGRKVASDDVHVRRAVRQRPAKPDFSAHTPSANPFFLGKVMPPPSSSYDPSAATNSPSLSGDKVDVFGAAPFHRKALYPVEGKVGDSGNNLGEIDVFANVPFVRQQERFVKAASSVSPLTATPSTVASVPNPISGSDAGASYGTFSPTESSHSTSSLHVTSSANFHQSSSGPMSGSFVPMANSGQTNVVSTLPPAVQPYGLDMQEVSPYAQQDSGPLLASPLQPATGKGHPVHTVWSGAGSSEGLDMQSSGSSKTSAFTADAGHEELQASEECFSTTGSLKRGWLAKLRSEKESPTTAVANLGFSGDPDAMMSTSAALPATSDLSFHEDMLDAMAEQKSPPSMAGELNFLLPSGEGSHTLPKVGVKKSHQHRAPPMPPETDSFSVTKKGIALL